MKHAGAELFFPKHYEWQHGWFPREFQAISPEHVVGTDGKSRYRKAQPYLVGRTDHASILTQAGYPLVLPIGLPICYVHVDFVPRVPASLLVVPTHATRDTPVHKMRHDRIASQAERLKSSFRTVGVMLHGEDVARGIAPCYAKRGLTVIRGASPNDSTSLERVAQVFSSYETVLVDGLSSPVVYAAYFGARVSIMPEEPEYLFEGIRRFDSILYRNCLRCAVDAHEFYGSWRTVSSLQFLLRDPHQAVSAKDWAQKELGDEFKLTPDEAQDLFQVQNGAEDFASRLIAIAEHRRVKERSSAFVSDNSNAAARAVHVKTNTRPARNRAGRAVAWARTLIRLRIVVWRTSNGSVRPSKSRSVIGHFVMAGMDLARGRRKRIGSAVAFENHLSIRELKVLLTKMVAYSNQGELNRNPIVSLCLVGSSSVHLLTKEVCLFVGSSGISLVRTRGWLQECRNEFFESLVLQASESLPETLEFGDWVMIQRSLGRPPSAEFDITSA